MPKFDVKELDELKKRIDSFNEDDFAELQCTKEDLDQKCSRCLETIENLTVRDLMTLWYIKQRCMSQDFYNAAKKGYEALEAFLTLKQTPGLTD